MKLYRIVVFLFFIFPFLSSNCKKDETKKASKIVYLRDKSLDEIKKEVLGTWKIHYRYGGITGNIKTPLPDSYFWVLSNDSIQLTFNGTLFAKDKAFFNHTFTIFNYSAYTIDFAGITGGAYSWIVDYTMNDTLVLIDNATNPDGYSMTKVQ